MDDENKDDTGVGGAVPAGNDGHDTSGDMGGASHDDIGGGASTDAAVAGPSTDAGDHDSTGGDTGGGFGGEHSADDAEPKKDDA